MIEAALAQEEMPPLPPPSDEAQKALARWAELAESCAGMSQMLGSQLPQVLRLVDGANGKQMDKHLALAANAKRQSEQMKNAAELASSLALGNQHFTAGEMSALFAQTLSESITKILFVSKRAMEMVYLLDSAIHSLSTIERFVDDIQAINRQAKLLAMNATIEAVRVGDAGKSFSVVAKEVGDVSESVQALASSMRERISAISQSVKASYSVLQEVATTDLEANLDSKEKLDGMVEVLVAQHANMRKMLETTSLDVAHLAEEISAAADIKPPEELRDCVDQCTHLANNLEHEIHSLQSQFQEAPWTTTL
ncbi:MAG: hypothetical protein EBR02_05965 [Alphaproteobacteria bacterium]|nr:hypothetical protein [Alphaproteobacteria bacterium]